MDFSTLIQKCRSLYRSKQVYAALELLENRIGLFEGSHLKKLKNFQMQLYQSLRSDPIGCLKLTTNQYTEKDLRKQYRTLILKYHPDKYKGSSEIFTIVKESYERLRKQEILKTPLLALYCLETTPYSIKLQWTLVQKPTEYELYFKHSVHSSWKRVPKPLQKNICQKHNLNQDSEYDLRVKYLALQRFSNTIQVRTLNIIPARPKLSMKSISDTKMRLSWEKKPSITSYHMEIQNVSTGRAKTHIITKNTFLIVNNDKHHLRLRVRAKNRIGSGYWSNTLHLCKTFKAHKKIPLACVSDKKIILEAFTTYLD